MVTILMATYNGEMYLRKQMESILAQTYEDWKLVVRDDMSTDSTPALLNEYAHRDSRIVILGPSGAHGSAIKNFSALFDYAYQNCQGYIMFCDQDDVWLPQKIASSLRFIEQLEQVHQKETPIAVYSGFNYIDADDQLIAQELALAESQKISTLLFENYAYGCTMIANNALVKSVQHIPATAENHDYWIALVAASFGKCILNPEKLINYRQHAENVSTNVASRAASSRLKRYLLEVDSRLTAFTRHFIMIETFLNSFREKLNKKDLRLLTGYISSFKKSKMTLLSFMIANKLRKLQYLQTFAHYYSLIRLRNKIINNYNDVSA